MNFMRLNCCERVMKGVTQSININLNPVTLGTRETEDRLQITTHHNIHKNEDH